MKCEIIDFEKADWKLLDSFADRTVFQMREWVRFLAESQNATPVLAEMSESGRVVVYAKRKRAASQLKRRMTSHLLMNITSNSKTCSRSRDWYRLTTLSACVL